MGANMISSRSFLLVVAIGTLFLADAAAAQVAPLIANIGARHTTNLDGRWSVIVDPYDVGSLDYRAKPVTDRNAFFKNYKPQSGSELVEYDFDTSGLLHVPGDWNTQRDSLLFYEGSIWYRRTFNYTKRPHSRLFVHFGAANYLAVAYLNGEELGKHEGGFTPFDFEITDRVRPEGNFLIVRVDNRRAMDLRDPRTRLRAGCNSAGRKHIRKSLSGFPRRGSKRMSKRIQRVAPNFPSTVT